MTGWYRGAGGYTRCHILYLSPTRSFRFLQARNAEPVAREHESSSLVPNRLSKISKLQILGVGGTLRGLRFLQLERPSIGEPASSEAGPLWLRKEQRKAAWVCYGFRAAGA